MKNQYFGDINDYKKYDLLRILSNDGDIKIAVCWMLTDSDKRSDGKFINYLNKPDKWKVFDPPLFDSLKSCFAKLENRNILWAETTNIITSAVFYTNLVSDNSLERQQYFNQFLRIASVPETAQGDEAAIAFYLSHVLILDFSPYYLPLMTIIHIFQNS